MYHNVIRMDEGMKREEESIEQCECRGKVPESQAPRRHPRLIDREIKIECGVCRIIRPIQDDNRF
jgi:hypothetical protein